MLLKDQKLQDHRRSTLEGIRDESEKNAMSSIQTKWSHLICSGISEPHRWPRAGSVLEHRPLSSTAEPAGNGQKQILDKWATESCMDRGPTSARPHGRRFPSLGERKERPSGISEATSHPRLPSEA